MHFQYIKIHWQEFETYLSGFKNHAQILKTPLFCVSLQEENVTQKTKHKRPKKKSITKMFSKYPLISLNLLCQIPEVLIQV